MSIYGIILESRLGGTIESFFQIHARDPITSFQGDKKCETCVDNKFDQDYIIPEEVLSQARFTVVQTRYIRKRL